MSSLNNQNLSRRLAKKKSKTKQKTGSQLSNRSKAVSGPKKLKRAPSANTKNNPTKKNWVQKHPVAFVFIVLGVLGAIVTAIVLSSSQSNSTSTDNPTSQTKAGSKWMEEFIATDTENQLATALKNNSLLLENGTLFSKTNCSPDEKSTTWDSSTYNVTATEVHLAAEEVVEKAVATCTCKPIVVLFQTLTVGEWVVLLASQNLTSQLIEELAMNQLLLVYSQNGSGTISLQSECSFGSTPQVLLLEAQFLDAYPKPLTVPVDYSVAITEIVKLANRVCICRPTPISLTDLLNSSDFLNSTQKQSVYSEAFQTGLVITEKGLDLNPDTCISPPTAGLLVANPEYNVDGSTDEAKMQLLQQIVSDIQASKCSTVANNDTPYVTTVFNYLEQVELSTGNNQMEPWINSIRITDSVTETFSLDVNNNHTVDHWVQYEVPGNYFELQGSAFDTATSLIVKWQTDRNGFKADTQSLPAYAISSVYKWFAPPDAPTGPDVQTQQHYVAFELGELEAGNTGQVTSTRLVTGTLAVKAFLTQELINISTVTTGSGSYKLYPGAYVFKYGDVPKGEAKLRSFKIAEDIPMVIGYIPAVPLDYNGGLWQLQDQNERLVVSAPDAFNPEEAYLAFNHNWNATAVTKNADQISPLRGTGKGLRGKMGNFETSSFDWATGPSSYQSRPTPVMISGQIEQLGSTYIEIDLGQNSATATVSPTFVPESTENMSVPESTTATISDLSDPEVFELDEATFTAFWGKFEAKYKEAYFPWTDGKYYLPVVVDRIVQYKANTSLGVIQVYVKMKDSVSNTELGEFQVLGDYTAYFTWTSEQAYLSWTTSGSAIQYGSNWQDFVLTHVNLYWSAVDSYETERPRRVHVVGRLPDDEHFTFLTTPSTWTGFLEWSPLNANFVSVARVELPWSTAPQKIIRIVLQTHHQPPNMNWYYHIHEIQLGTSNKIEVERTREIGASTPATLRQVWYASLSEWREVLLSPDSLYSPWFCDYAAFPQVAATTDTNMFIQALKDLFVLKYSPGTDGKYYRLTKIHLLFIPKRPPKPNQPVRCFVVADESGWDTHPGSEYTKETAQFTREYIRFGCNVYDGVDSPEFTAPTTFRIPFEFVNRESEVAEELKLLGVYITRDNAGNCTGFTTNCPGLTFPIKQFPGNQSRIEVDMTLPSDQVKTQLVNFLSGEYGCSKFAYFSTVLKSLEDELVEGNALYQKLVEGAKETQLSISSDYKLVSGCKFPNVKNENFDSNPSIDLRNYEVPTIEQLSAEIIKKMKEVQCTPTLSPTLLKNAKVVCGMYRINPAYTGPIISICTLSGNFIQKQIDVYADDHGDLEIDGFAQMKYFLIGMYNQVNPDRTVNGLTFKNNVDMFGFSCGLDKTGWSRPSYKYECKTTEVCGTFTGCKDVSWGCGETDINGPPAFWEVDRNAVPDSSPVRYRYFAKRGRYGKLGLWLGPTTWKPEGSSTDQSVLNKISSLGLCTTKPMSVSVCIRPSSGSYSKNEFLFAGDTLGRAECQVYKKKTDTTYGLRLLQGGVDNSSSYADIKLQMSYRNQFENIFWSWSPAFGHPSALFNSTLNNASLENYNSATSSGETDDIGYNGSLYFGIRSNGTLPFNGDLAHIIVFDGHFNNDQGVPGKDVLEIHNTFSFNRK